MRDWGKGHPLRLPEEGDELWIGRRSTLLTHSSPPAALGAWLALSSLLTQRAKLSPASRLSPLATFLRKHFLHSGCF